jgi:murein DD-endopeptidase MepM/ murein hydrolase activator NlpD
MDLPRITSELLELREDVIAVLGKRGVAWQVHFTAIEIDPDCYGIRVLGIVDAKVAIKIGAVLRRICPTWHHWPAQIKDFGGDPGYAVLMNRDYQPPVRQWEPPNGQPPNFSDEHVYELPYAEGQTFRIMQGYGGAVSHQGASHYALDFAMPIGTPVLAARSGVVVRIDDNQFKKTTEHTVEIDHENGTTSFYVHLNKGSVTVRLDQRVIVGEVIGRSGSRARPRSPHLHFHVCWLGERIPTFFRTCQGERIQLEQGKKYTRPYKSGTWRALLQRFTAPIA